MLLREHRTLALGRSAYETFAQSRDVFEADIAAGMAGKSARLLAQRYPVLRAGHLQDAWFDVDYAPIRDETGAVAGVLWTLKETTAHHLTEQALRASETRHRLLIESWAQAVWETDGGGVVVADSPSWRGYTGQTLEEWLGYGWLDAIHPSDRAYAERQWREAVAVQGLVDAEFRLRSSDGGWRWTNVRAAPVLDGGGRVQKWLGMNIDIDVRKRAELALRDSEDRYRTLFKSMDEAYAVVEVLQDETHAWSDFRFLDVNPAFMQHTSMPYPVGKTATELLGTPNPRWTEMYGQVLDTGMPLRVKEHEQTLGRTFDLNIFSLDRERNRVAVLFTDITERLRAEAALRESEARYRSLFQRMGQGYCELTLLRDAQGRAVDQRYIAFNPAFERLFGIPVAEAAGKTASEVFPGLEPWWHEAFDRIARNGYPERIEYCVASLDRWFEVYAYPAGKDHLTVLYEDVTERRRAEDALRASEERQAFLLRLSDAIRPLADAAEIQAVTTQLLGVHLDLDRAMYVEVEGEPGNETGTIRGQYVRTSEDGLPSVTPFPERFAYNPYGEGTMPGRYRGDLLVVADIDAASGFDMSERAAWATAHVRAAIVAPLVKGERLVAEFGVHSAMPRAWTDDEVSLVREVAERTWAAAERARAEAALRAGEDRLRLFGEASSDVLWMRDAETLQWIYLTPAFEAIYGLGRETALRGDNMTGWLDLIVPEDRQTALDAIQSVRKGERISFEYRIRRPGDGAVRWLRNTDFPMRDESGRVCWLGGVGRDITEEKASAQRQDVLVNELQHRARNLLGVVTAVASRTVKQGSSVEAFEERLQALSRAQALLSQQGSDTVEVGALVRAELAAYAQDGSMRVRLSGPEVQLTARQVQNFALALHELTTNAVKYGALKDDRGWLTVTWEVVRDGRGRPRLALSWNEGGVIVQPQAATRRGYGTELIQEALAYALDATVCYTLGEDGVRCEIKMPVS